MSLLRHGSRAAARSLRQPVAHQPKRFRSSDADHQMHGHGHGHSESAYHVKGGSESGSESFGKGLYVSLAAIPIAYLTYVLSSSDDNFISRTYHNYRTQLKAQDVLHAAALEQAISDKSTIFKEPRGATRDLRFPEMFNAGSPWNVVAGQGTANLKELESYYIEQRNKIEEERVARMSKSS